MIHFRHVSHCFGEHWALKDCSFSLDKGDFLFLSGPSGAGKSTLLQLLYAALPVQRGEVRIASMDLKKISGKEVADLRRQVGVVFQDFKVLPLRTVRDNIALPLEVRGLLPQHIDRRVRAVARVLGLDMRLNVACGSLSGGEQQRVAIARAFVVNPLVLLADEPTGNLDPALSVRLMELFKQFQAYGTTVIFATHSMELMQRHPSARVMRLEAGMITEANWAGAKIFSPGGEGVNIHPHDAKSSEAQGATARASQNHLGHHTSYKGEGNQGESSTDLHARQQQRIMQQRLAQQQHAAQQQRIAAQQLTQQEHTAQQQSLAQQEHEQQLTAQEYEAQQRIAMQEYEVQQQLVAQQQQYRAHQEQQLAAQEYEAQQRIAMQEYEAQQQRFAVQQQRITVQEYEEQQQRLVTQQQRITVQEYEAQQQRLAAQQPRITVQEYEAQQQRITVQPQALAQQIPQPQDLLQQHSQQDPLQQVAQQFQQFQQRQAQQAQQAQMQQDLLQQDPLQQVSQQFQQLQQRQMRQAQQQATTTKQRPL